MKSLTLLPAIVLMALAGCAGLPVQAPAEHAASEQATRVLHVGDAIVYRGSITAEANAEMARLLEEDGSPRWLEIESVGGNIGMGMDLADLILAHALNVRVVGLCASSCANYAFVAGRQKEIVDGGLLVWHGSAIQENLLGSIDFDEIERDSGQVMDADARAAFLKSVTAGFERHKERQKALYQRLGIDERITVFGQDIGCECQWTFSVADMAAFGLRGVTAPMGYPKPEPWWERNDIRQLVLADHPRRVPESNPR